MLRHEGMLCATLTAARSFRTHGLQAFPQTPRVLTDRGVCHREVGHVAEAKYNTAEHKRLRREYGQQIARGEGWCVEPVCVMPSRYIQPGTPGTGWHVPHNEDGVTYRGGPAHMRCNTADGGRRRHVKASVATRWVL